MHKATRQILELAHRGGRRLTPLFAIIILITASGELPCPTPARLAAAVPPTAGMIHAEETQPGPSGLAAEHSAPKPAPDESLKFEHLSVTEGLSQSSVNCILQDDKGFMWFGTQDGLNRYDGYDFAVFRPLPDNPNSLSHNFILSLFQDRAGTLWIGTNGEGLDRYDKETRQFINYRFVPGDPHSLSANFVFSILQDRDGILWIGTAGGLNRYDPDRDHFIHYVHDRSDPHSLSDNSVRSIFEDQDGTLWIGTGRGGLDKFDREMEHFTHFRHDPADPQSLSSDFVRAIYQDRAGVLWIGTEGGGLDQYDPAMKRFINYEHKADDPNSLSNNSVRSIYQDREGLLWIGTDGGGLNSLDRETGHFVRYQSDLNNPFSLSSDFIGPVFEDQTGTLWIGTHGGGINKIDRSTKRFAHYRAIPNNADSPSNNLIWALVQDRGGTLWVGTNGGGLDSYDRDKDEWRHFQHDPADPSSLSSNIVRSIFEDRTGDLWIGTQGGCLDQFDRSTENFVHFQVDENGSCLTGGASIQSIFQDGAGALWIGFSDRGLGQFDPSSGRLAYISGWNRGEVRAIRQGPEKSLWIGTSGGLVRWDPDKGWLDHYHYDAGDSDSLSSNLVMSVFQDRSGILWVGTFGGGLNRFEQDSETFIRYREQDGLPSDVVYGILEDERGYLWLSTNMGLSQFDPQTETFANYDMYDGLQSNEFNAGAYFQNESGEMFFGGINGFNAFYPERIVGNPFVPPIVLTALTQDGQELMPGQAVENIQEASISWPKNFFEFEFTALNFSQPEKNQYAYMLQDFDDDWNHVGTRRFGRYTNLPGGNYLLRIIGSNDDGVWNMEGVSVTITIVPPFWESWWFQGMVLLMLAGTVVGAYLRRVRGIETQTRELESQVNERTAELLRTNELLTQEIAERRRAEEALAQQAVEAAVLAERNRLARELHDAVTQTLFSASLIAEVVPRAWEADPESGRQQLEQVRLLTRGALAEMRALLLELRPEALAEAKMEDLLLQLGRAMSSRTGIPVSVSANGCSALPPVVQITFYRITQEALNNASKHADANQVWVALSCEPGRAALSIQDDGRGFDVDKIPPGHLGVGIMRERAASIDARLTITSEPGEGTAVAIDWQEPAGEDSHE